MKDPKSYQNQLDKLFGYSNFRNEIIWQRTKSHNDPHQFGRIHDTLLYYGKSKEHTWNTIYLPYDSGYSEKAFRHGDKNGRKYQTQPLHASKPGGDTYYEWKGQYPPKGRFWAFSKANMEKLDQEGRIVYSKTGVPRYKIYVDEAKGRPLQDVWTDIPGMHQTSGKERLGYPTQKPEELLNRIIRSSSNPMDIVLDPFCGCGTAIVVAHKLGRQWIGIDVSPTACNLMQNRMRRLHVSASIMGMPLTEEDLRKLPPFEFQNWVVQRLFGRVSQRKSSDMGIDGFTFEGEPIQVKQSDDVGRNVVDNFETAMRRRNAKKGIIVAFSFGKGAFGEVARASLNDSIEIKAITVKELLRNQNQEKLG